MNLRIDCIASSAHHINPFDLPAFTEEAERGEEDPLAERVTALLGLLEQVACDCRVSLALAKDEIWTTPDRQRSASG